MHFRVFIGLILLVLLAGCGGNKLVGTWTGTVGSLTGDVTYKSDGTMEVSVPLPTTQLKGVVVKAFGTYKLDKDTLAVTLNRADVESLPAQYQAQKQQIISSLSKGMQVGTEHKAKIEFPDADTYVTTSADGQKRTLTRKN